MAENPKQPQVQIRRPGSQVAPGQKPLFRDGPTASTHMRVPVMQATAGKRYRVRDKVDANGVANIWGEDLSYDDAVRLKERVVGMRRSKTARVEEMSQAEIAAAHAASAAADPAPAVVDPTPDSPPDYTKMTDDELRLSVGDDHAKWTEAFVQHAEGRGIQLSKNDITFLGTWFKRAIDSRPSSDSVLEGIRKKAIVAAAPVARQAQVAHEAKKPKPVVMSAPPTPPPSPLSDEEIDAGPAELPPDDEVALDGADIQDIASEVGGAPTELDRKRAAEQAAKDEADTIAAAKNLYDATARDHAGEGPWPTWEQLGQFEHAAWRFYAMNGGVVPALVKQPRKVEHAMGSVEAP